MADDTEVITLEQTALVTTNSAGLTSSIIPQGSFLPNFVLRSDPSVLIALSAGDLTTTGDILRIMIATPSAMPDYTFYPIALTCSFSGEVAGTGFWELPALYTIVAPVGTNPTRHAWRSFSLDSVRTVMDDLAVVGYQTAAPVFQSFPPSPVSSEATAISAIGGFQFTVDTFDAADKAAIKLSVDARWLAFPRSAVRNAGFYTQRMFFKPN